MEVVDERTVNGTTLQLKRKRTTREGKQFEYMVTERGSNSRVGRVEFTREDGMRQLRETVKDYKRAERSSSGGSGGPSLPGMGGGSSGGPRFMGLGHHDDGDEDEEYDGFPFMP